MTVRALSDDSALPSCSGMQDATDIASYANFLDELGLSIQMLVAERYDAPAPGPQMVEVCTVEEQRN